MVSVADQVDQIGESRAPLGAEPRRSGRSQDSKVSGGRSTRRAALPAAGVDVVIDRMVFPTTYGTHRNDVAQYFRQPNYRDTGFTATIPANAIPRRRALAEHSRGDGGWPVLLPESGVSCDVD